MKKFVVITATLAFTLLLTTAAFAAWSNPQEMIEHKTDILEQRVEEGVITEEQAEEILSIMAERMENCTGEPAEDRERLGQRFGGGLGFGRTGEKGTGQHAMARGNR